MAQQAQVKNYWTFVAGLITEAGPLTFPENSALDLSNVVLDVDGSITPRNGFEEVSREVLSSEPFNVVDAAIDVTTYMWLSAGGAEAEDLYVVKIGTMLYFARIGSTPLDFLPGSIDLSDYRPTGTPYSALRVAAAKASMAAGDGRLYVVTPYTNPVVVEYNVGTSSFSATELVLLERDLEGIDDGTDPDFHPSELTAEHKYNLLNSGWNDEKLEAYFDEYGQYPSRSEDPWTGVVEEINPSSGAVSTTFRPEQYRALGDAGFGTSEASKGHFVLETFDTTNIITIFETVSNTRIQAEYDNPTVGGGATVTDYDGLVITVTVDDPVMSVGNTITLQGTSFRYNTSPDLDGTLDGAYTVTAVAGSTYQFYMDKATAVSNFFDQALDDTATTGDCYDSNAHSATDVEGDTQVTFDPQELGIVEYKRFESVAFFAGRAWYAGVQPDDRTDLAGRVYYSQTIRTLNNASRAYQANDPSAKNLNEVVDTDGGYITINDLGVVHAMIPFRTSLIIISTNGVWEIGAGDNFFTPTSYVVRRLTDRGSRFKIGPLQVDGRPCYWSTQGIEIIAESQITGFPERQSLTDETIKRYVNVPITSSSVYSTYDTIDNKAYFMYKEQGAARTTVLCFDTRLGAFYPWHINDVEGVVLKSIDHFDNGTSERLRVLSLLPDGDDVQRTVSWLGLIGTDNTDNINTTSTVFSAFIESSSDLLGDGLRTKQAVKVASFFERDELASCFAQGRYSFSDGGVSGKWNNKQQAYRDAGQGHSLSRSRLRMRGSGTAFRIRYSSDSTKPFKLYGWSILYTGGSMV